MKLLNIQRNELFDNITAYGLSPSQFTLSEINSTMSENEIATVLRLNNSKFYFMFETYQSENHYLYFSPGQGKYTGENLAEDWDEVISCFHEWLNVLFQEITAEDKWTRLENEVKGLKINFTDDQDKFSANEYIHLKEQISTLKDGVQKIGLTQEQTQAIINKLDHLTELATEMNKFDWKSMFIGTIVSIIIQLSVTPQNAMTLWTLIKQVFSTFILP